MAIATSEIATKLLSTIFILASYHSEIGLT
jgi:hypothetical protein